jgi:hypothetical protein
VLDAIVAEEGRMRSIRKKFKGMRGGNLQPNIGESEGVNLRAGS